MSDNIGLGVGAILLFVVVVMLFFIFDSHEEKVNTTTDIAVESFEYDGHTYLWATKGGYGAGICHSPDCPCHKKEKENE